MRIYLPASSIDDLKWDSAKKMALSSEEKIEWVFDLGIKRPHFVVEDEAEFRAISLALSSFTKNLYPEFSDRTERVVLYQGPSDFTPFLEMTERQEENWKLWQEAHPKTEEAHMRRLFAADTFAYYFQCLAHMLPDEVPIALRFSSEGSRAEKEQLLSRERFEHFQILREELDCVDAPVAILFPKEALCTKELLAKMETLLAKQKMPYRVIAEPFLTEEWGGVDALIVLKELLSKETERKLAGFRATGGEVRLLSSEVLP